MALTLDIDSSSAIERIGDNIRQARLRRNQKQSEVADRCMISRPTYRAIERGDPTVKMGYYIIAISVLGLIDTLDQVASPELDAVGKSLEKQARPKRVRGSIKKQGIDNDF